MPSRHKSGEIDRKEQNGQQTSEWANKVRRWEVERKMAKYSGQSLDGSSQKCQPWRSQFQNQRLAISKRKVKGMRKWRGEDKEEVDSD